MDQSAREIRCTLRFPAQRRKQAERPSLLLRGLFAHGTAEEFGQCGIEGGAGLLLNLLYGFIEGEGYSFWFVGSQVVKHLGDRRQCGRAGVCGLLVSRMGSPFRPIARDGGREFARRRVIDPSLGPSSLPSRENGSAGWNPCSARGCPGR